MDKIPCQCGLRIQAPQVSSCLLPFTSKLYDFKNDVFSYNYIQKTSVLITILPFYLLLPKQRQIEDKCVLLL